MKIVKKRCVIAGASSRALVMFTKRIGSGWCPEVELTGIFDINPGRVLAHCRYSKSAKPYDDFDRMLDAEKPDIVIVTTVDAYHHEYIIKALEAGCDVITEKPMTIDAEKVGAILEAERRTGKKVTVTFNYRFVPFVTKIKEIMLSGQIGEVYNVHMEWMLDRNVAVMGHGASYFRRWNRYMEKSGGLLVHKSTHHFDIINWFIGQNPVKVSAFGELRVYGRNGTYRGERCRTCGHKGECKFFYDIGKKPADVELYLDTEKYDGYFKDKCLFDEDIDIYDTMAVNVRYDGGALLSYSLNAAAAYEGWRMSINGSKGRLEVGHADTGYLSQTGSNTIRTYNLKGEVEEHTVLKEAGEHGGGDERLFRMLFDPTVPDPLGHMASSTAGAHSVLIGAAANVSIRTGRIVDIPVL